MDDWWGRVEGPRGDEWVMGASMICGVWARSNKFGRGTLLREFRIPARRVCARHDRGRGKVEFGLCLGKNPRQCRGLTCWGECWFLSCYRG